MASGGSLGGRSVLIETATSPEPEDRCGCAFADRGLRDLDCCRRERSRKRNLSPLSFPRGWFATTCASAGIGCSWPLSSITYHSSLKPSDRPSGALAFTSSGFNFGLLCVDSSLKCYLPRSMASSAVFLPYTITCHSSHIEHPTGTSTKIGCASWCPFPASRKVWPIAIFAH